MRRNTVVIYNVLKKKNYEAKFLIISILKNKLTKIILEKKNMWKNTRRKQKPYGDTLLQNKKPKLNSNLILLGRRVIGALTKSAGPLVNSHLVYFDTWLRPRFLDHHVDLTSLA